MCEINNETKLLGDEEEECRQCGGVTVLGVYKTKEYTLVHGSKKPCCPRRESLVTYCGCGPIHPSCLAYKRGLYPKSGWEDSLSEDSTVWKCQLCHVPYRFAWGTGPRPDYGVGESWRVIVRMAEEMALMVGTMYIIIISIGFFLPATIINRVLGMDSDEFFMIFHFILYGLYLLSIPIRGWKGHEVSGAFRVGLVRAYVPLPMEGGGVPVCIVPLRV